MKRFNPVHLEVIATANQILRDYAAQGYDLTLRQLYYQFIAKDAFPDAWLRVVGGQHAGKLATQVAKKHGEEALSGVQLTKNSQKNYDMLGDIVSDARLAGKLDWHAIVDRTREIQTWSTHDSPAEAFRQALQYYQIDPWENQPKQIEIWVEKEALASVIERVAQKWLCPYLSCRGYISQSSAFQAFERIEERLETTGQETHILHLGDHDPSGVDMTRDNDDRLDLFLSGVNMSGCTVDRIALNMDQVEQYSPPPSPAKITDSRCESYVAEFGEDSWELDALEPSVLEALMTDRINEVIDHDEWQAAKRKLRADKAQMQSLIEQLEANDEDEEE